MKNRISSFYDAEVHAGHHIDEEGNGYLWIRIIFGGQCYAYTDFAHDVHKMVDWLESLYLPGHVVEDAYGALGYHFEIVCRKCSKKTRFEKMIDWCIGYREESEE